MKRLVACIHRHDGPPGPEAFDEADPIARRLLDIGGKRVAWGADRQSFELAPEAFTELVETCVWILTNCPGHSAGIALRELQWRRSVDGSLRACGLALSLAEAMAVAAKPAEGLLDPEIAQVVDGSLPRVGSVPVRAGTLSLRAALLLPGPSSLQAFFDVHVLPLPAKRASETPAPPSTSNGPLRASLPVPSSLGPSAPTVKGDSPPSKASPARTNGPSKSLPPPKPSAAGGKPLPPPPPVRASSLPPPLRRSTSPAPPLVHPRPMDMKAREARAETRQGPGEVPHTERSAAPASEPPELSGDVLEPLDVPSSDVTAQSPDPSAEVAHVARHESDGAPATQPAVPSDAAPAKAQPTPTQPPHAQPRGRAHRKRKRRKGARK